MSNTELIKELRSLTQAGMKDCKDALEEANWDLQKAVDIVKVKGLNVVSGRAGKIAADGVVAVRTDGKHTVMVEVNCQTDFVAQSPDFLEFVDKTTARLLDCVTGNGIFSESDMEPERQAVVAKTKENVVIRQSWAGVAGNPPGSRDFFYVHSNNKIGVMLALLAPSEEIANSPEFQALGNDMAMQVAAMSPIAVSSDRLKTEDLERQKNIFETQLTELNKPQAAWPKILEGKFNKWYTEVCLLNQESIVLPKTTVGTILKNVSTKLGGEITVINFIRCQVGEGIEKNKEQLADEVAKLM